MNLPTLQDLVQLYDLKPHPEGGFYKETYRDKGIIPQGALPSPFKGDRNFSTAIYFLIPEGKKSCLHRIQSDELWHFYLGGPLTIVQIFPEGRLEKIVLGQDVMKGQKLQHVVPHGSWFGAYPHSGSDYSFVGCTVAPGFDFADFEMGERENLLSLYPQLKEEVKRLTNSL